MDIFSILALIGGLALFLYGMDEMGDGLKKLSGGKLETILSKLTSTKFKAFLLGLGVTAVIQSSSATTVMLVGFVNAGIMKLGQTLGIIMGANVGTTVTGWLLSLSAISSESTFILKLFKPESFTPILALIGLLLIMTGKTDKKRNLGKIFIGFAILMFGMESMSDSMGGLKDDPAFAALMIKFENPFLGILMGLILTAIIQSSSASVGILQALSITGLVPVPVALPIILGQNIGTTVTPIISSIGGNTDARRVAMACLYIKMIGVIVVCAVFYALNATLGFDFMDDSYMANPVNIAVIHTAFNIVSTVILLPFTSLIEKFVLVTVKEKSGKSSTTPFRTLDPRFLTSPAFAVETSRQLVSEMAVITKNSLLESMNLIGKYDSDKADELLKTEDEIDIYEDKISSYLLQVSEYKLSQKDSHEVSQLLHVVGDIERISDHSVNIIAAAKEIHTKEVEFSLEAQRELSVMSNAIREILSLAIEALVNQDLNIAKKVEPLEQIIDKLNHQIKRNHVERLRLGECTIELGFILSDILNNCERVADHCSNIAVCLLEIDNNSFQTHEYLSNVKETGANEFFENYDMYKQRYSL